MADYAAHAVLHLLRLPGDDARLAQLAATAVLMEQDCPSCGACWSSAEMNSQMEGVLRLQERSLSVFEAGSGAGPNVVEAAALHAAFEQMREAVRAGQPLPPHEELLVKVARTLFGRDFACARQVQAAVVTALAGSSWKLNGGSVLLEGEVPHLPSQGIV
eukprot:CAMPEP_0197892108 /NCGR_PEP_ID=MMETSP1439-20131203/29972_1 /TAXON_ID=66791 /ORGANISM="Gonyaulax spinifera, Strain CCMP409" /LENGTH=159 /DNA_ID=CAMNT_0043512259 /DNA_START=1 /DNA_END=480 /DNA_ORIENTATION=+